MAHVAWQADAAGHTPKADCDFEKLRLLCYDLAGLHAAHHHGRSYHELSFCWNQSPSQRLWTHGEDG